LKEDDENLTIIHPGDSILKRLLSSPLNNYIYYLNSENVLMSIYPIDFK
jgi:hypothetical protein